MRVVVEGRAVPADHRDGEPGEVDVRERAQDEPAIVLEGAEERDREGRARRLAPPDRSLDLLDLSELLGLLEAPEAESLDLVADPHDRHGRVHRRRGT